MRDILSLTGGQPLAGQIRSRRICPSLAAFLQLELFRVYTLPTAGRHQPGCSPFIPAFPTPRAVGSRLKCLTPPHRTALIV
ncbi:hypothetical protein EH206_20740 [Brenneria nigrifluens DSM 30175 = ATCC 13028]|uniref:Uncharacterized protein n=1 Tax=Brenneria nigrifluens DSM 30175 = ATCC 13028 TaxID=1121120 RepID=A0A2U1UP24_9GAMM|nr:hypothetical protein DDT54_15025 [Brenneria nigrifluens DSM 30175 = ATCC 13028]QCR06360.1 hypothetical protein EH206_20740 [Brenneria nigrifluens DSM 30175 = ATCC 13028]